MERMRRFYREGYSDFTVKHFHEELRKRHHYTLGYTVTRLALQSAGLVRQGQTARRLARSVTGGHCLGCCCLGRFDASLDRRVGHDLDLVVTMDDATGAIYSAILVERKARCRVFSGCAR